MIITTTSVFIRVVADFIEAKAVKVFITGADRVSGLLHNSVG